MNFRLLGVIACLVFSVCFQAAGVPVYLLAPATRMPQWIAWGHGVVPARAELAIRRVLAEEERLALHHELAGDPDSIEYIFPEHLKEVRERVKSFVRQGDLPAEFREKLGHFIRETNPRRPEWVSPSLLKSLAVEILECLFEDLEIELVASRHVPALFGPGKTFDPGIPLPPEFLQENPRALLGETVRNTTADGRLVLVTEPTLWIEGQIVGTVEPDYFIIPGEFLDPRISAADISVWRDPKSKETFTLLSATSSSPDFSWEARGLRHLVFVDNLQLGDFRSLEIHPGGASTLTYHTQAGAHVMNFAKDGTLDLGNKKARIHTVLHPAADYPRVAILGGKVVLQTERGRTLRQRRALVYRDIDKKGNPGDLKVLRYRSTLYHASGILEMQRRLKIPDATIVSRFVHGALESTLEEMSLQGTDKVSTRLIDLTHELASLLDETMDRASGLRLDELCRTQKIRYEMARRFREGEMFRKDFPLNRIPVQAQEAEEVVAFLIEECGARNGLGATRDGFFELFHRHFKLETGPGESPYAWVERGLEKASRDPASECGRIKIGKSVLFGGGKDYYFHIPGFRVKGRERELQRLFTLLEEGEEESLSDFVGGIKDPELLRFISRVLTLRMRYFLMEKETRENAKKVRIFGKILDAIGQDPVWRKLALAQVPAELRGRWHLLLQLPAEGEKARRGDLCEEVMRGFFDAQGSWREEALPLLLEAVPGPAQAESLLRQLSEADDLPLPALLKALRDREATLRHWQDLSYSREMDLSLVRLYARTGFHFHPGIQFLLEVACDEGEIEEEVLDVLGELFEPARFAEELRRGDSRALGECRNRAIETMVPKIFMSPDPVRAEAARILKRIEAPAEVLPRLYRGYRSSFRKANTPDDFYALFRSLVERQRVIADGRRQVQDAARLKTPSAKRLKSREELATEIRRFLIAQKGRVYLLKDSESLFAKFRLDYLQGNSLSTQKQHVVETFVKTFLAERPRHTEKGDNWVLFLESEEALRQLALSTLSSNLGAVDLETFVLDLIEGSDAWFLNDAETPAAYEKIVRRYAYDDIEHVDGRDVIFSFPASVSLVPPRFLAHAARVLDEGLALEQRKMSLLELSSAWRQSAPKKEDHLISFFITQTAEKGLGDPNPALRVPCFRLILSAYMVTGPHPSTLSRESHELMEKFFSMTVMDSTDMETGSALFAISHPHVPLAAKRELIFQAAKRALASPAEEKAIVERLFACLEQPALALEALQALHQLCEKSHSSQAPRPTLREEIKARFKARNGRAIADILRRGMADETALLLKIHSEAMLLDTFRLGDFSEALTGSPLPFPELEQTVKLLVNGSRQDVRQALLLAGTFPDPAVNAAYAAALKKWLLYVGGEEEIVQACLDVLAEAEPPFELAADLLLMAVIPKNARIKAASRLNREEGGTILLEETWNGDRGIMEGNLPRIYEIARGKRLPEKTFAQGNIYHGLVHLALRHLGSREDLVGKFEREVAGSGRGEEKRWETAKERLVHHFGYEKNMAAEELFVKILEFLFVGREPRLAGISDYALAGDVRHFCYPLTRFLENRAPGWIPRKREPRKKMLIRMARSFKAAGTQLRLHPQRPESRCSPLPAALESSL